MLLKELIDNAIDACETAGTPPAIQVAIDGDGLAVTDNGPGIPPHTVAGSLDFSSRTSSNNLYVSPTRGQLGNALKCLYVAGLVAHGQCAVTITARGVTHTITVAFDPIRGEPVIDHDHCQAAETAGTVVKVRWPDAASELAKQILTTRPAWLAWHYRAINPRLTIAVTTTAPDGDYATTAGETPFKKWTPASPPPVHWFTTEQFQQLLCAFLASDPQMYCREFILQFAGMKSTAVQKAILDELGLARVTIADAFTADGKILEAKVRGLCSAMESRSNPAHTRNLGAVGSSLADQLLAVPGADAGSLAYKKMVVEDAHRPFIVEVAFVALDPKVTRSRIAMVALNHSPIFGIQTDTITSALSDNYAGYTDPVAVMIHMISPQFQFTDRGKSRLELDFEDDTALCEAVDGALKGWKKLQSRKRRDQRVTARDIEKLSKPGAKVTIKDAAYAVMAAAYDKASGGGKLPADARQIMYAARGQILAMTGKGELDDQYFTQTLLPDFQAENPELTANWDVVYKARGNLFEPHTGWQVPLGTVDVRNYTSGWREPTIGRTVEAQVPLCLGTSGPAGRYGAALFIEKEGFTALFKAAQTAELYDVAIFSTKGMSTTASRSLVEHLSAADIPILLLHDFDASGMSIARTIQEDGRRFKFKRAPQVIDLGLRLEHAKEMDLESEPFKFKQKKDPGINLRACGATDEEIAFLVQEGDVEDGGWRGERVELNAMTSPEFVEFVHGQLEAHGVAKVVPDQDALAAAYRHVIQRDALMQQVQELIQQAETADATAEIFTTPDDLEELVRERIKGTADSWIDAIKKLAQEDNQG